MKFTKLMALVLVLVMLVSAFAACGDGTDTETDPPVTDAPETDPPETESESESESESETEAPCEHPENRQRKMDEVVPTCTEAGYIDYLCRLCDEQWRMDLPATHTYGEIKSVDGKYTRHTCVFCGVFYVTDEAGATVEDASAIVFPFFTANFTDAESFADLVGGFPEVKLVKEEFIAFVTNAAEGNTYINVPTGTSALAPNGYFELSDVNNKLTTKDFSVKFAVQFTEFPKEAISLLTWKLGGTEYDLLTIDATGKITVLGSEQSKTLTDKGWDVIEVCFDNETGDYYVYMNTQIFAKGMAKSGKGGYFRDMSEIVGRGQIHRPHLGGEVAGKLLLGDGDGKIRVPRGEKIHPNAEERRGGKKDPVAVSCRQDAGLSSPLSFPHQKQGEHGADGKGGALGGIEGVGRSEKAGGVFLTLGDDALRLIEAVRAPHLREVRALQGGVAHALVAGHMKADGRLFSVCLDKIRNGRRHSLPPEE